MQGQFFLLCAFRSSIGFRLIVSQHNQSRKDKWHACCVLACRNDVGKANRQAIRRRKSHTDGEKTMTISLHSTRTSAPNTAAATSVSPLDPSGSSKTKFSKTRTDIYQTVTDNIIAALEAGVKPWSCPWQRVDGMSGLPSNYATGAAYSGMNIMLLWCSASKQGFSDSRWMTYKQAQVAGGQVRKGEHGTTAIFYTTLEKENDAGEVEHIPMLKTFTVFNVQQIDGLTLATETVSLEATFDPLPQAENLFRKSGANIIEKGQNAFFIPSTDEVWLPERHLFSDAANFYATGLHELVHWSGGKKRLNREMKGKFGSADYAEEELVAELGSAFLMADLGIEGEVQHESYIASWLKALKNDKRYIFKAASAASKTHRYLMDKL
jgi:antirestriction protein ArdC